MKMSMMVSQDWWLYELHAWDANGLEIISSDMMITDDLDGFVGDHTGQTFTSTYSRSQI